MTRTDQIRRRADGSIDTAHYMGEARARRSETALALLGERRPRRRPVAAFAPAPFARGQL